MYGSNSQRAGIHQISAFRSRQNAWFAEIFPDDNCRDRRLRRDNLFRNQRQFLRTADDVAFTNPRQNRAARFDDYRHLQTKFHFTKWRAAYGSVNSSRHIDRRCNFYSKE